MMHRRDLHPQFRIYQVGIDQMFLSNMACVVFLYSPWYTFRYICLISLISEHEEGLTLNH